jgi:hypothetical protein
MQRNYTAEDVKRYRDEHSCSVFEAKGHFEKKFFMDMISEVRLTSDMKLLIDVVEELVRREKFH